MSSSGGSSKTSAGCPVRDSSMFGPSMLRMTSLTVSSSERSTESISAQWRTLITVALKISRMATSMAE